MSAFREFWTWFGGKSRILPVCLCLGLALTPVTALAQSDSENPLSDLMNELLKGSQAPESGSDKAAPKPKAAPQTSNAPKKVVPQSRQEVMLSYAPLVKRVSPAVVNVYAARKVRDAVSPFRGDPFFEHFFGPKAFGRPRQRVSRSLGSGVIVEENGLVVTNHHVIKGADKVKVALADGREFDAKILLIDEKSDLAVMRIKPDEKLASLPLGNSDRVEVGDIVLAIGNPFGVGQTVTNGIISALARNRVKITDFGFFIQTDAAINPGNSGGALIDMQGRLIGINTAIFSRSGGSNGIGFAVPANMVNAVIRSANAGSSRLQRPWIGASFQSVTADIADSLGLDRPRGALIAGVIGDGPAEQAGLSVGDIILKIDGFDIEHVNALGYRLTTAGIGKTIAVEVLSRGKTISTELTLAKAPETTPRNVRQIDGSSPFTGARVANLSPALAQELDFDANVRGVIVLSVARGSSAERFDIRPRDVIVEINREKVQNVRQLARISNESARLWRYIILRKGQYIRQFVR
ncbi:MAG: DegQ family serine endoprotease [Pseudomonadota bacterium]